MHYAKLNDGRQVIVDTSSNPVRRVKGEEFFVDSNYREVLLGGGWQIVRVDNMKNTGFGSPFEGLR